MKEVDKKHMPEVSGGYLGVTDPPGYPIPETDYPQYPNGDPTLGEGDLPAGTTY